MIDMIIQNRGTKMSVTFISTVWNLKQGNKWKCPLFLGGEDTKHILLNSLETRKLKTELLSKNG